MYFCVYSISEDHPCSQMVETQEGDHVCPVSSQQFLLEHHVPYSPNTFLFNISRTDLRAFFFSPLMYPSNHFLQAVYGLFKWIQKFPK